MAGPFTMSIEATEGNSKMYGFHLGTDEKLAREIVTERYQMRVKANLPVVTIALMRDHKIVDVFMGDKWSSEIF